MTLDLKHARELLTDPDAEDCERFASWYGTALLDEIERLRAALAPFARHFAVSDNPEHGDDRVVQVAADRAGNEFPITRGDGRAAARALASAPSSGEV